MSIKLELFARAARSKVRFATPNGNLSVENLWDLRLQGTSSQANLDDIAKGLQKEIREAGDQTSFVTGAPAVSEELQLKFDLVKYIIEVRVEENKAKTDLLAQHKRREELESLIREKEGEALKSKTIEELKKELEAHLAALPS